MIDALCESVARGEAVVGMPVVVIATTTRADRAYNLDDEASRLVASSVAAVADASAPLGLVVLGTGGEAGFADGVLRAARAWSSRLTVWVASVVRGSLALVALGADARVMLPEAGLGAYDAGLQGACYSLSALGLSRPDMPVAEQLAAQGHRHREVQALAAAKLLRGHAHAERLREELGLGALGDQLSCTARELAWAAPAWPVRESAPEESAWLRAIAAELERLFALRGPPQARYTASDLGDEVEFAPATGVEAALVATSRADFSHVHILDTGSPDPDTQLLQGRWQGLEEGAGELELDWDQAQPVGESGPGGATSER